MKRYLVFSLILLLFAFTSSFAQVIKGGKIYLVGGLNLYNQNFGYSEGVNPLIPPPRHEAKLGYCAGVGVSFDLSKRFFLETNVLYKEKRSELVEFSGVKWGDTFYKLTYLALPLLAHYRLPLSEFSIFATLGVEADICLISKIVDKRNNIVIKPITNIRKGDLQLISGFGVSYRRLSLGLRYGFGLVDLNKEEGSELTIKNRGWEFMVSYCIRY